MSAKFSEKRAKAISRTRKLLARFGIRIDRASLKMMLSAGAVEPVPRGRLARDDEEE